MTTRSASEGFFAAMEAELNKERAAVLGRYGRRLEASIAKCAALLERVEAGDEVALVKYRELRTAAVKATEALCLQREMIGVLDHSWVQRAYPLPPRR
jgi:hypothetical protein